MKTKDRIKEEIGLDKLLLTIFVAAISSILSWTWGNKETLSKITIISVCLFISVLTIMALVTFFKVKFKILELDKYEY